MKNSGVEVLVVRSPQIIDEPSSSRVLADYNLLATILKENSISSRFFNADFHGQLRTFQLPSKKEYSSFEEMIENFLNLRDPKWRHIKEVIERERPEIVFLKPHKVYNVHPSLIFAEIVKKISPDASLIVSSRGKAFDDIFMESEHIDVIVREKGDLTEIIAPLSKKILSGDDLDSVPNLIYKNKGEWKKTETKILEGKFEDLPSPDRDLVIDKEKYPPNAFGDILAGRGCKWGGKGYCTFCGEERTLSLKKPERVVEEIKETKRSYGTRDFNFNMTSFTASKEWASEVCKLIEENNLNIVWRCYCNAVEIGKEIIKKMEKSGCYAIGIGFESGSPRTLERMKKPSDLDSYRKASDIVSDSKILLYGSFMIGYPDERWLDVMKTLKMISELNLDVYVLQFFVPSPNLDIFKQLKEKGKIKDEKFWEYSISRQKVFLDHLESEKMDRIWDKSIEITNKLEMRALIKNLKNHKFFRAKTKEYLTYFGNRILNFVR